jgi:hypothetical protein
MTKCQNASFTMTILLSLVVLCSSVHADESVQHELPFSSGESLSCSIAFDGSTKYTAALFTPINDRTWIGWIWLTAWGLDPIRFDVAENDADGIKFVGTHGPFDIRAHISSGNQYISVVRASDKSSESVYGEGYCAALNEDDYEIEVQKSTP